jgi:hypothetical protein
MKEFSMNKAALNYKGFVPPCGIFCGSCPLYTREKNPCKGAEVSCKTKKCKGFYVCCIEKKGLNYCFQCKSYPCSRFKKFAERWSKYGQDLFLNQEMIKELGKEGFIVHMNPPCRENSQ